MKLKLISIALLYTVHVNSQTTAIPDPAFESALIDLGFDTGPIDGSVPTSNIDAIQILNLGSVSNTVTDLSGIENFTALNTLWCQWNQLTSLDVSQNANLVNLICFGNQLTSLTIPSSVTDLICDQNNLTELDLSQNVIINLQCHFNNLNCLNLNNDVAAITEFEVHNNPNLTCIEVDDVAWANANLSVYLDPQNFFSDDCGNTCSATAELAEIEKTNKELLMIVDYLGRETIQKPNTPLIYIYSDGTRERLMEIEN